jgi:hypothetical protein
MLASQTGQIPADHWWETVSSIFRIMQFHVSLKKQHEFRLKRNAKQQNVSTFSQKETWYWSSKWDTHKSLILLIIIRPSEISKSTRLLPCISQLASTRYCLFKFLESHSFESFLKWIAIAAPNKSFSFWFSHELKISCDLITRRLADTICFFQLSKKILESQT